MSVGSKQVAVRMPADLLDEVKREVNKSIHTRKGEPWTTADFVRCAVWEKLDKLKRGRAPRRKKQVVYEG